LLDATLHPQPALHPKAVTRSTRTSASPAASGRSRHHHLPFALHAAALLATANALLSATPAQAAPAAPTSAAPPPITAIASLNVPRYMGTWYQVAWFPNRFQRQCVSDTAATYRQLPGGQVEVLNRCKRADGQFDEAKGLARPAGSQLVVDLLQPAQLQVSFLPAWLRWVPAWGSYWVIELAEDGRYAVVSEPKREYLWVLARAPRLQPDDETAIRSRLTALGYDLSRWQRHPHTAAPADTAAR